MHTIEPGTSHRRARQIIINNPAKPLTPPEPVLMPNPDDPNGEMTLQVPPPPTPSVTFHCEDRVIMADGSEMFVHAPSLILNLDDELLKKLYPSVNIETGEIDNTKQRYGAQIVQMIMDALEDVFVNEGMARDAQMIDKGV